MKCSIFQHALFRNCVLFIFCFPAFLYSQQQYVKRDLSPIERSMLQDQNGFFFVNFKEYKTDSDLPIGVFDSGTGGLAILNTILTYDQHSNATLNPGGDGEPDFERERFIFLADQANMPYGNYGIENKTDLLVEHVFKDVQFLLSDKYYMSGSDSSFQQGKMPVKTIVIACNTATAFAKSQVEIFIKKTGVNLKLIGVIDAGAKGVMEVLRKDEDASIAVMATVGTIASGGYERAINAIYNKMSFSGKIKIYNQGGYGLAESIDGEPDFVNAKASGPAKGYKGPSFSHNEFSINRHLLKTYNFDFANYGMLCDNTNMDECNVLQINSPVNYLRYHLVSLLEKIKNDKEAPPLRAIVLGCTHYPYLIKEIGEILEELYNDKIGDEYVYRSRMAEKIVLIDPAENVAEELFSYLKEQELFNKCTDYVGTDEFYITVPNLLDPDMKLNEQGGMHYDYKYGREAGVVREYVKSIPFLRTNIPAETLERLSNLAPAVYSKIKLFEINNNKLIGISDSVKILE